MSELEQIVRVVRKHHLMTLATVSASDEPGEAGLPWVAHAFYAWVPELSAFVFTTDPATRHGQEMLAEPPSQGGETFAGARVAASGGARVAAGIALETRVVGRVQGIQIEGEVRQIAADADGENELSSKARRFCVDRSCEGEDSTRSTASARRAYLKRFPYAAAMDLTFWTLTPTTMKLTDNTLGFGTKIVWNRQK